MRVAMGILQNLRKRFGSRQQGDASRSQGDESRSLSDAERGSVKDRGSVKANVEAAFVAVIKKSPYLDFTLVPSTRGEKGLGIDQLGSWVRVIQRIFDRLGPYKYPPLNADVVGFKTHKISLGDGVIVITNMIHEEMKKSTKSNDQIA
jgi:hypothetical protein